MAIKEEIINLLRSSEVSRINFRFNGILVNGELYSQVANAMEGAQPRVRVVSLPQHLPAGVTASYDPNVNVLNFKFNSLRNVDDRALVVHEATHAGFDLARRRIWAGDDEACAYIAETLYHRYAGDDVYENAVYAVLDDLDAGRNVSQRNIIILRDAIFSSRRHGSQPYRSSIGQRSLTNG
jgi:hypothetical protein